MIDHAGRVWKLHDRGRVESHSDAAPRLIGAGDFVIVDRGRPRSIVIACPDGCGEVITLNLDSRVGPSWRMYRSPKGITLYPSVWRDSGCRSHFIIWNDKIYWCDTYEDWVGDDGKSSEDAPAIDDEVLRHLSTRSFIPYFDLASRIDAIPWSVLLACRRLERAGLVECGVGENRTSFRLLEKATGV